MSQTEQLQNSLSSVQLHLLKYCYSSSTNIQEETKVLIQQCTNDDLLAKFDFILNGYVLPYFFIHRANFNRLRNRFVEFMHLCLTNQTLIGLTPYSFLMNYKTICFTVGILQTSITLEIFNRLYKQLQLEIPELI